VWPWDIVKMYVVLLTELLWRRNSIGRVADFPFGRERRFVASLHTPGYKTRCFVFYYGTILYVVCST